MINVDNDFQPQAGPSGLQVISVNSDSESDTDEVSEEENVLSAIFSHLKSRETVFHLYLMGTT